MLACRESATSALPWHSRVRWVRPGIIAVFKDLIGTKNSLLRHVVDQRLREDKPASDVWPARDAVTRVTVSRSRLTGL